MLQYFSLKLSDSRVSDQYCNPESHATKNHFKMPNNESGEFLDKLLVPTKTTPKDSCAHVPYLKITYLDVGW